LLIPANITILALPPKSPELNPVENIWQYMRDNWLSNRIFKSYDDIVDQLLLRLEYARRSALENHVHRITPVGSWVLINKMWYKLQAVGHIEPYTSGNGISHLAKKHEIFRKSSTK